MHLLQYVCTHFSGTLGQDPFQYRSKLLIITQHLSRHMNNKVLQTLLQDRIICSNRHFVGFHCIFGMISSSFCALASSYACCFQSFEPLGTLFQQQVTAFICFKLLWTEVFQVIWCNCRAVQQSTLRYCNKVRTSYQHRCLVAYTLLRYSMCSKFTACDLGRAIQLWVIHSHCGFLVLMWIALLITRVCSVPSRHNATPT